MLGFSVKSDEKWIICNALDKMSIIPPKCVKIQLCLLVKKKTPSLAMETQAMCNNLIQTLIM